MNASHKNNLLFIGGGNMATAIIAGLYDANAFFDITVIDRNEGKLSNLKTLYKVSTARDLNNIGNNGLPNMIILAVKPKDIPQLCRELQHYVSADSLIISIAAGITVHKLKSLLPHSRCIIRAMPNTPASVGMGITILHHALGIEVSQKNLVNEIFTAVGSTVWVDNEEQINPMMAISGCGPAYVFLMCESLMNAASNLGVDQDNAKKLVSATIAGAIQLFSSSSKTAEVLRSEVTSPNGTTAAAIAELNPQLTKKTYNLALAAAVNKAKIIESELENL